MIIAGTYYSVILCFFEWYGDHRGLHVLTHSCPTRRSSDLFARRSARVSGSAVSTSGTRWSAASEDASVAARPRSRVRLARTYDDCAASQGSVGPIIASRSPSASSRRVRARSARSAARIEVREGRHPSPRARQSGGQGKRVSVREDGG